MPSTLRFCGRESEIVQIIERWRLSSNVADPNPQIVLLKAERGLGKTRLGMEFCRWLSENADGWLGKGYWPNSLQVIDRNLPVNPEPYNCDYMTPIPYLWWGLRCADPGAENSVAGDAISTHDRFLTPHLVSLMVKARMKDRAWSVAKAWGDVGLDLAANALQYDTVLSIGKGLLQTGRILLGTVDDQARSAAAVHSSSRADAVLQEMEGVFKPGTLTYAGIPAVIFLDDAQFAHFDPALPGFLERLVHRVIVQKWPVLLLVTHWKAELSSELSSNSNAFSIMLQHARTGSSTELRPITGVPGGFLLADHFAEIDLAPVADLAPALRAELRGLTEAQLGILLSEMGGNPRLLEQVVAFLREHENYFEGYDPAAPLTAEGVEQTLEEIRSQDIFKIVLRRLRRAPEDVQEAICLASLQGIRFVSGLVESLAEATVQRSARQGLQKAEDPYSILVGTSQDSTPIGEFAERLFLQVATERRQSLKSLGGEQALQVSFRDAVQSLLADSEYRRRAPADALAIAYTVAARLFESSPLPVERLVAQRALSDLGVLEVLRNSLEAAAAAWERLLQIAPTSVGAQGVGNLIGEYQQRVRAWELLAETYLRLRWPSKAAKAHRMAFWETTEFLPSGFDLFVHSGSEEACSVRYSLWCVANNEMPNEVTTLCVVNMVNALLNLAELSRVMPTEASAGDDRINEWTLLMKIDVNIPAEGSDGPVPYRLLLAYAIEHRAYALDGILGKGAGKRRHFQILEHLSRGSGDQSNIAEAEGYATRALQLARELDDEVRQAATLSNLAVLAGKRGDLTQSRSYLLTAKDLVEGVLGGESLRAQLITTDADPHPGENISEVTIPKRLVDRLGGDHMDDVLHEWRVLMKLAANIHGNLGVHDLKANNFKGAKHAFLRAVDIRKQIGDAGGDLSALVTDFENLAVVADAEGDSASACQHRQHKVRVLRTLENIHSDRPEARMWSEAASRALDELREYGCDIEGLE